MVDCKACPLNQQACPVQVSEVLASKKQSLKNMYSRLAASPTWETPASPLTQPACLVQVSEVLESGKRFLRNWYSRVAEPPTWEILPSPQTQPACPVQVRSLKVQGKRSLKIGTQDWRHLRHGRLRHLLRPSQHVIVQAL
jgi:hypothetical protein